MDFKCKNQQQVSLICYQIKLKMTLATDEQNKYYHE